MRELARQHRRTRTGARMEHGREAGAHAETRVSPAIVLAVLTRGVSGHSEARHMLPRAVPRAATQAVSLVRRRRSTRLVRQAVRCDGRHTIRSSPMGGARRLKGEQHESIWYGAEHGVTQNVDDLCVRWLSPPT